MLWWNVGLKSIFLVILAIFLYRQIFHNQDLSQSWKLFQETIEQGNLSFLIICVLLMPLNWLIESIKWRLLVLPFEKISRSKSFKAILSGVSIALLTPNRIGEYGGRMLLVEPENNWNAVISTLVSSYAQNIWNIGLGLVAAILLLYTKGGLESYLLYTGLSICLLFLVLIMFFFFNIELSNRLLKRWEHKKYIGKALKHLGILEQYKSVLLLRVLAWALVRYATYLLQYYLILRFFGLHIDLINGFIGIGTIFLVQTSLPLPPILGFLARGEIALVVWENMDFNNLSILAASYSLWILNLIVPSLIGSAIILTSNLSRSFGLSKWKFRRK